MRRVVTLIAMIWSLGLTSCAALGSGKQLSDRITQTDLGALFGDTEGTFVLYDTNADSYLRYNPSRAKERFSPCSTFKIPNTLIGLETCNLENASFVIPWDQAKYPKEPWWDEILLPSGKNWARDHELKTAFEQSVVWYYRELAIRVGEDEMNRFLQTFDYGNRDTTDGIDVFWLTGSMLISADEQVEFLKKFYFEKLGLSLRTTGIAKDVFVQNTGPDYTLSAKTGTGGDDNGGIAPIAWYVGYVERNNNVFFFALNLTGRDLREARNLRDELAGEILERLSLIDPLAEKSQ